MKWPLDNEIFEIFNWIPFEIGGIYWNYSKEVEINLVWSQSHALYLSGYGCEVTAEEVKEKEASNRQFTLVSTEMELLMKHYRPVGREEQDLFQTIGEIEVLLRKETEGLIKISCQQLGKVLGMLRYIRDNRYTAEKGYPIRAYYLKFRNKKG